MMTNVVLTKPTPSDRDEFLRAARRSRALHRRWITPRNSSKDFDAYLARVARDDHEGFLVRRRDTNELAGAININAIVRGSFHSGYLGYYAFAPHAGRGLMTEALQLVMRHAFTKMKLHRLEANIQPENVASIALVERCGFRLEGFSPRYLKINNRWRDHQRYAITIEEWRENVSQKKRPRRRIVQLRTSRRVRPA